MNNIVEVSNVLHDVRGILKTSFKGVQSMRRKHGLKGRVKFNHIHVDHHAAVAKIWLGDKYATVDIEDVNDVIKAASWSAYTTASKNTYIQGQGEGNKMMKLHSFVMRDELAKYEGFTEETGLTLNEAVETKSNTSENKTSDNQTEATAEKATSEEVEQMNRMEKGILLYRETAKGGDYGSTVESASYTSAKEGNDNVGIITARVTIQNVREDNQTVDLSEIEFSVQDEKTGKSYDGQAMPFDEGKFKTVPAGYSLTFDVSFMIKNPPKNVDNFYLYMNSSVDPFEDTHWKLDNLTDSKS